MNCHLRRKPINGSQSLENQTINLFNIRELPQSRSVDDLVISMVYYGLYI